MSQCILPRDLVSRLFDYGMIDWIIFTSPKETEWFGKKIKVVIGNMLVSESVQAQIYSFPLKSYGLTEEHAKHEIFVLPIASATYFSHELTNTQFMDNIDFYLYLEQEKRRAYQPL